MIVKAGIVCEFLDAEEEIEMKLAKSKITDIISIFKMFMSFIEWCDTVVFLSVGYGLAGELLDCENRLQGFVDLIVNGDFNIVLLNKELDL